MTDLVSQLDVPRYPTSQNKRNPLLDNPLAERDPESAMPEIKDPPKRIPTEKEPPLTEEDSLNPANNPMQAINNWNEMIYGFKSC